MLVGQLKDILGAYQLEGTDTQRVDAIGTTLIADVDELLNECEQNLAYAGRNHLPFLLQSYKMVRAQLLNCTGIASPKASSEDQVVERLIEALYKLRDNRSDIVLLDTLGLTEDKDLRWMSAQWKKSVLVRPTGKGRAEAVHRRYFELAVMHAVKDDLKSGDLFIKYGERYDDYREQLVDDETFEKEVGDYGQVTGIETDPGTFVAMLKSAMSQRARDIDATFPENAHAEIVDGRLILRKPPRSEIVEAASIVDVMIDTERWLDLHKLFRPLAGTDSRLEDLRMRVITTLFCYGCNLGPVQTAKSIKGLSRRQISWLNLKYVSEDLLDKAIVKVINAYNKFELPGYWGTGKHASADGTKWNLYEQNLLSEHHIRYGGCGGIGYYHVSDKFIALFSHFIWCGTYEGIHILDGLMTNESDIRPDIFWGRGDHCGEHPARAAQGYQIQPLGGQHDHSAQRGGHDEGAAGASRRGDRDHAGDPGRPGAVPHGAHQPIWGLHAGFPAQDRSLELRRHHHSGNLLNAAKKEPDTKPGCEPRYSRPAQGGLKRGSRGLSGDFSRHKRAYMPLHRTPARRWKQKYNSDRDLGLFLLGFT